MLSTLLYATVSVIALTLARMKEDIGLFGLAELHSLRQAATMPELDRAFRVSLAILGIRHVSLPHTHA